MTVSMQREIRPGASVSFGYYRRSINLILHPA
jgi:hypothetical protein